MNPRVFPSVNALMRAAAELFIQSASEAIRQRGVFHAALSGGTTPQALYRLLATGEFARQVDWSRLHVYFGDERMVPPDHPESNYRMAQEALLGQVPVPKSQIHRIHGENPEASEAAALYELEIRQAFGIASPEANPPRLDLIWLGLGKDGHTASLFPGSQLLLEAQSWVAADWIPQLGSTRVSLTYAVINRARKACFLVEGEKKASIVHTALETRPDPLLPSQRVCPEKGQLLWLMDAGAASLLSSACKVS